MKGWHNAATYRRAMPMEWTMPWPWGDTHGMPIGRALPMEWPIRNPKAKPWHGHGGWGWGRHQCSHHRRALSMEWPMPWPWGWHPWSAHRRPLPMEWPIRHPKAMPWHGHGGGTHAAIIEEPCLWNGPCHGHGGGTHGVPIEEPCPWNGQSGSPRQCHGIYQWG